MPFQYLLTTSIHILTCQKLFLCFHCLISKDKSKTGGGKLQRKQGLEKQLRHHSAAVQTGGKWKYTKTDRWTLTKQRHVIPKFHALETFNSPFSFGNLFFGLVLNPTENKTPQELRKLPFTSYLESQEWISNVGIELLGQLKILMRNARRQRDRVLPSAMTFRFLSLRLFMASILPIKDLLLSI